MNKNHEYNKEYAKKNECYVEINGKIHRGSYELNLDDRTAHLYFNNKHIASKKMWRAGISGFEQTVEVDGEEVHCVLSGNHLDIAIHGRYIKSLQTYVPVKTGITLLYSMLVSIIFMIIIAVLDGSFLLVMLLLGGMVLSALPYSNYEKKSKEEQRMYEDTGYEEQNKG